MANLSEQTTEPNRPLVYQIRLKGVLDDQWAAWFAGMRITWSDDGETLLTGPVLDQAALYGLLRKVRDLGLPLMAVIQLPPDQVGDKW